MRWRFHLDKHKELYVIQQIYGTLFALANKLQTKGDAYLSGITSRQFMVMLAILHLPEGRRRSSILPISLARPSRAQGR